MSILKTAYDRTGHYKEAVRANTSVLKELKGVESANRKQNQIAKDSVKYNRDEDLVLDPMSNKMVHKKNTSKVAELASSNYTNNLLERMLKQSMKPEMDNATLDFRNKNITLLASIDNRLEAMIASKAKKSEVAPEIIEVKKEYSELSKNIASLNIEGALKDLTKAFSNDSGTFGLMKTLMGGLVSQIKEGGFGKLIQDELRTGATKMVLGERNAKRLDMFKDNPVEEIQAMINQAALSNSPLSMLAKPHYKGTKFEDKKNTVRDMGIEAAWSKKDSVALTEVIPTYLSRIERALGSQVGTTFDFANDKWLNDAQLVQKHIIEGNAPTKEKNVEYAVREQKNIIRDIIDDDPDNILNKYASVKDGKLSIKNEELFKKTTAKFMSNSGSFDALATGNGDINEIIKKFKLSHDLSEDEKTMLFETVVMMSEMAKQQTKRDITTLRDLDTTNADNHQRWINTRGTGNAFLDSLGSEAIMNIKRSITGKLDPEMVKQRHQESFYGFGAFGGRGTGNPNGGKYDNMDIPPAEEEYPSRVSRDAQNDPTVVNRNAKAAKAIWKLKESVGSEDTNVYADNDNIEMENKKLYTSQISNLMEHGKLDPKIADKILSKGVLTPEEEAKKLEASLEFAKYAEAQKLFNSFYSNGLTATQLAGTYKLSVSRMRQEGYPYAVEDFLDRGIVFINNDNIIEIDYDKLKSMNRRFTKSYMDGIDKENNLRGKELNKFDITNPADSAGKVMDTIFRDPKITKMTGIGAGTAAGLAVGKMLKDAGFIKSPKAMLMLGAIGAGLGNMERVQNSLNGFLGPDGGVKGASGYSNREILVTKMLTKWLPTMGVSAKVAKGTYSFLSKFGVAGKLIGIPASILTAGAAAMMVEPAKKGLSKLLFGEDGETDVPKKGFKGFMRGVGSFLSKNTMISKYFNPRDNRTDKDIAVQTLQKLQQRVGARIKEIEAECNGDLTQLTPQRADEMKTLLKLYDPEREGKGIISEQIDNIRAANGDDATNEAIQTAFELPILADFKDSLQTYFDNEKEVRTTKNEHGLAADAKFDWNVGKKANKDRATVRYSALKERDDLTEDEQYERDFLKESIDTGGSIDALMDKFAIKDTVANVKEARKAIQSENSDKMMGEAETLEDIFGDKYELFKEYSRTGNRNGLTELINALPEDDRKTFDEMMKSRLDANNNYNKILKFSEAFVEDKYGKNTMLYTGPVKDKMARDLTEKLLESGHMEKAKDIFSPENVQTMMAKAVRSLNDKLGEDVITDRELGAEDDVLTGAAIIMGGGKGKANNKLSKMKDLNSFKFRNGNKLSDAGCSIVSFNNMLKYMGQSTMNVNALIDIAENYVTKSGGVTTGFYKKLAEKLNFKVLVYRSTDNKFSINALTKLSPTNGKGLIALLDFGNQSGHYVTVKSIGKEAVIIDDPEETGLTTLSGNDFISLAVELVHFTVQGDLGSLKESFTWNGTKNKIRNKLFGDYEDSDGGNTILGAIKNKLRGIARDDQGGFGPAGTSGYTVPGPVNSGKDIAQMETEDPINKVVDKLDELLANKDKSETVNVRIVEDLTLPLQMTDSKAAKKMTTFLGSNSQAENANTFVGDVKTVLETPEMKGEQGESQEEQENIALIASNSEGLFGGRGKGAGPVDNAEEDKSRSNPGIGGALAGPLILAALAGVDKVKKKISKTVTEPISNALGLGKGLFNRLTGREQEETENEFNEEGEITKKAYTTNTAQDVLDMRHELRIAEVGAGSASTIATTAGKVGTGFVDTIRTRGGNLANSKLGRAIMERGDAKDAGKLSKGASKLLGKLQKAGLKAASGKEGKFAKMILEPINLVSKGALSVGKIFDYIKRGIKYVVGSLAKKVSQYWESFTGMLMGIPFVKSLTEMLGRKGGTVGSKMAKLGSTKVGSSLFKMFGNMKKFIGKKGIGIALLLWSLVTEIKKGEANFGWNKELDGGDMPTLPRVVFGVARWCYNNGPNLIAYILEKAISAIITAAAGTATVATGGAAAAVLAPVIVLVKKMGWELVKTVITLILAEVLFALVRKFYTEYEWLKLTFFKAFPDYQEKYERSNKAQVEKENKIADAKKKLKEEGKEEENDDDDIPDADDNDDKNKEEKEKKNVTDKEKIPTNEPTAKDLSEATPKNASVSTDKSSKEAKEDATNKVDPKELNAVSPDTPSDGEAGTKEDKYKRRRDRDKKGGKNKTLPGAIDPDDATAVELKRIEDEHAAKEMEKNGGKVPEAAPNYATKLEALDSITKARNEAFEQLKVDMRAGVPNAKEKYYKKVGMDENGELIESIDKTIEKMMSQSSNKEDTKPGNNSSGNNSSTNNSSGNKSSGNSRKIIPPGTSEKYAGKDGTMRLPKDAIKPKPVKNNNFVYPVGGSTDRVIPSAMGPRPRADKPGYIHKGIDIRGTKGEPILASKAGKVEQAGGDYGIVKITSKDGYQRYIHNDKIHPSVKVGSTVEAGQQIATLGGRGPDGANHYDPHLHFETFGPDGKMLDPMRELGIPTTKLKIPSSPENIRYMKKHENSPDYDDLYAKESIAAMAADKEKGSGPDTPEDEPANTPAPAEKATPTTNYISPTVNNIGNGGSDNSGVISALNDVNKGIGQMSQMISQLVETLKRNNVIEKASSFS